MHNKLGYTLLLILLSLNIFSQTRKIAYKSHSGNTINYYAAANPLFESSAPDFGIGPERLSFLDSVVFLTDTSSIFSIRHKYIYANDSTPDEVSIDTFLNKSIFGGYQDNDSLKNAIINRYVYFNDIDSVKFIDRTEKKADTLYLNKDAEIMKKKEIILPVINIDGNDNNNNGTYLPILVGILLALSILLGVLVRSLTKQEINPTQSVS